MLGKILKINSEIRAFDDSGQSFQLSPGDSALILDENQCDMTILSYGVILYIPVEAIQDVNNPC